MTEALRPSGGVSLRDELRADGGGRGAAAPGPGAAQAEGPLTDPDGTREEFGQESCKDSREDGVRVMPRVTPRVRSSSSDPAGGPPLEGTHLAVPARSPGRAGADRTGTTWPGSFPAGVHPRP